MKMFICPECGQINRHFLFCPEMPEPLETMEDDEPEQEWVPSYPRFIEQDADE